MASPHSSAEGAMRRILPLVCTKYYNTTHSLTPCFGSESSWIDRRVEGCPIMRHRWRPPPEGGTVIDASTATTPPDIRFFSSFSPQNVDRAHTHTCSLVANQRWCGKASLPLAVETNAEKLRLVVRHFARFLPTLFRVLSFVGTLPQNGSEGTKFASPVCKQLRQIGEFHSQDAQ